MHTTEGNTRGSGNARQPSEGSLPWRPIFEGAEREAALAAALGIAGALRERCAPAQAGEEVAEGEAVPAGLAGGQAGLALLFAYLARARSDPGYEVSAARCMEGAVEALADCPMPPSLYGGFPGIAWAATHLQGSAPSEEDPNAEVDAALLECLGQSPWTGEYDLVSGLVGVGVYALERARDCRLWNRAPSGRCGLGEGDDSQIRNPQSAIGILEKVVERLGELAVRDGRGIAWFTPARHLPLWHRERCPGGYFNLGVAHGVPGVIALLGGACAAGVAADQARSLLEGAVPWLLDQRLGPGEPSSFRAWIAPGYEPCGTRLAWCYGDAGVAAALLAAARGAGEPAWEREAVAIARRAAGRDPDTSGVHDAGLCHGAAGVGHLFNRMFQATQEPALGEAARYWFARALALRQPGRAGTPKGIGGYLAWEPLEDGTPHWTADPGFLTGAAGIALALLAAATPVEPEWDRVMLASLPRFTSAG